MLESQPLFRLLLAECLGTFMLVFAGTGAIIVNDVSGGAITHIGIAAVFGLIVLSIIYTYGETSGAHVNPAVTMAFWLAKRFPGKWVVPYITSQFIGAVLASIAWYLYFPQHETLGATIPAIGLIQAFVLEFLLTWWLMTAILGVSEGAKETGIVAGMVIGGAFAGPITGASMNPARSLGPEVVSGNLSALWVYLLATPLGAMCAVFTCRFTKGPACCGDEVNLEKIDG